MVNEKKEIIKFFKEKKVTKHSGVTCSDITIDRDSDSFFVPCSKEQFAKDYLREDYVYIVDDNWDRCFFDEDQLLEWLEDDFEDYLKTLIGISDLEHDSLLDIYSDKEVLNILDIYNTSYTNKEKEE